MRKLGSSTITNSGDVYCFNACRSVARDFRVSFRVPPSGRWRQNIRKRGSLFSGGSPATPPSRCFFHRRGGGQFSMEVKRSRHFEGYAFRANVGLKSIDENQSLNRESKLTLRGSRHGVGDSSQAKIRSSLSRIDLAPVAPSCATVSSIAGVADLRQAQTRTGAHSHN
jgi:hypothetical protein